MTPTTSKKTLLCSLFCLWIQWIAIVLFLWGFLPIKEPMSGLAQENQDVPVGVRSEWLKRKVGQVVLVVVDALRADFVMPGNMVFGNVIKQQQRPKIQRLHELVQDQPNNPMVNAFVARANAPTVTMPRIKALVSGTIPGFIDVVLNFGSSKFNGDNLLDQWKAAGFNMTMFGDDTWLKLFPEHFIRSDGTTSFFVSDYTQVDDNVTRHLEREMKANDWDVAILHYLGLDHIGHLVGPDAPMVPAKLAEMSDVIEFILDELMNNQSRWRLGLPPLVIVLGDHGMADAGGHGGSSVPEIMTPMIFLTPLKLSARSTLIKQQDLVPTMAWLTGVPIPRNNLGSPMFHEIGLEYVAAQIAKSSNVDSKFDNDDLEKAIMKMVEAQEEVLTEFSISLMAFAVFLALMSSCFLVFNVEHWSLVSGLRLLHIVSLVSTSFIEEEHQVIYFVSMTILTSMFLKWRTLTPLIFCMVILRCARAFNQTGDKWRHLPSINDWLKESENSTYLKIVMSFSIVAIALLRKNALVGLLLVFIWIQKMAEINANRITWPAQVVYLISVIRLLWLGKAQVCDAFIPILAVITQPYNMILLPMHIGLATLFRKMPTLNKDHLNIYYFLGWALYFNMGNSNGLASIDVGSAYVGVTSFNPMIVGTLLALGTFSGPILWILMAASDDLNELPSSFVVFRGLEITAYLVIVLLHRHHLFVWTVFSPKLLYLGMAVLVVNILITFIVMKK